MTYDPKLYWEKRLDEKFSLSKVGHIGFNNFYNKWLYKAKKRTLIKALSSQKLNIHGKTVCDIGCGTGFFVDFYKSNSAKDIVGVDIASICVKNLKLKYPEYHFIEEDISSPSLISKINRIFDIVNVFDILYHIKDDISFEHAISNIANLTMGNGFIFITDLFGSENIDIAKHVTARSKKTYEKIFNENSLEIVAMYPLYYLLNRPIFRKSMEINLDNLFAPIYYYLDGGFLSIKRSHLKLMMVKKVKS
ncbi:MAG: class I SAM-dependent methyltransferase [Planctomycetota bacterium]|jgi:SAM-dependent methyltransferase